MSTFTSPRSEAGTILLWGDRWWLPDRTEPIPFAHRDRAAGELVAALAGDGPRRLRLIYQPAGFTSVVTPCPQTDRRTLALALHEQYPALVTDEIAWSHDPILAVGDGFTTVLHSESTPWLSALTTQLAESGLAVESAWPLATWLQALPSQWHDSGASTVLIADGDRACAYHHPASGPRQVIVWPQPGIASPPVWFADLLGRNPAEPVVVVTREPRAACAWFPPEDRAGLHHLTLTDALAQPAMLPRRHPAQLLPPAPWVTAPRAVLVASLALLAAAGGIAAPWATAHVHARHVARSQTALATALSTEVAHLRANAKASAALRSELAARPVPWAGPSLRRMAATVPGEVTLSTLQADAGSWVARGFLAPTAPATVLDRWRSALASGDARASVQIEPPPNSGHAFRLRSSTPP